MTTDDLRRELRALLRAFYAEEYQRDRRGEPSGVWYLRGALENLLETPLLNAEDPGRWLPPASVWRAIVDAERDPGDEPVARDVRRLRRDVANQRAWQRIDDDQGRPARTEKTTEGVVDE